MTLSGTVVVTGAASGIGRAVAELILERDPHATVLGLDRTVVATGSDRFRLVYADVAISKSVQDAFAALDSPDFPPLRHLVCAAGIQLRRPSVEMSPREWHDVLGVHLDGAFFCAQQARLRMAEGGSMVMFSSVAEVFGWSERAPYAAAKAGVSAMVRSLAVEWAGDGVRVNAVAPGYVETPLVEAARRRGDMKVDPVSLHAQGRLARPVEIAAPVRFLLSDDASFITGETLFVDGGYRIFKGV